MKIYLTIIYLIIIISLNTIGIEAKVKLPSIFSYNMVLQQQADVKLWGQSNINASIKITTSWDNKAYKTQTDSNGNWNLEIITPKAGGPYHISFDDGDLSKVENILIGEVWFCSGQSNMEMPMKGFDRQPVKGANDIIIKAKKTTPIRIFTTDKSEIQYSKKPQSDCNASWWENTSPNVAETSAVAYYFARYIQEVLDVPVGIIVSSWGGSRIEPWMSYDAIKSFNHVDLSILDNEIEIKNPSPLPCVLYNAKIAPFTNYTIKGFLWYQGESNRENALQYKDLMSEFVKDLRAKWNKEFPFYFVQIAPYNYNDPDGTSAAQLREAQLQSMKNISNCGMITTLDIGNPVFIHPMDKETVGKRLAYWALGQTYNMDGFGYAPPIYKSMEIAKNKIYINLDNAPRGIYPMWTSLGGFEIAGNDKIFHSAYAEIETSTARLAVSCEKVPDPVAVRYAYKNYAEASIFSLDGIPVAPFRTDNW